METAKKFLFSEFISNETIDLQNHVPRTTERTSAKENILNYVLLLKRKIRKRSKDIISVIIFENYWFGRNHAKFWITMSGPKFQKRTKHEHNCLLVFFLNPVLFSIFWKQAKVKTFGNKRETSPVVETKSFCVCREKSKMIKISKCWMSVIKHLNQGPRVKKLSLNFISSFFKICISFSRVEFGSP